MIRKYRKISSISGIITNSSTEIFVIWGEDSLKRMINSGVFKGFKKNLLYLKTDDDVINFITKSGRGYNNKYYSEMLNVINYRNLISLYKSMIDKFPERKEEILEFFKPEFIKEFKGTMIYYDYIHNKKILNLLKNNFPDTDENENYVWTVD